MIRTSDFIEALSVETLGSCLPEELPINTADLNRPGLQFTGHYDYFAVERPQIIGKAEMSYLNTLDNDALCACLGTFFSHSIPCVIICRGLTPPAPLLTIADEHGIPVFGSQESTTRFFIQCIFYLRQALAQKISMHGVLVDVYGVGVMITGRSGVGKSEAALELIKRGHQLVADDVVEVTKVSETRVSGESPEMVRHLMEIRGIGIIDIKAMYGIGSVLQKKPIDLVIHLENWDEKKTYDRYGMTDEYTSIMDVPVPRIVLPVRPGRNLAVIIEVAARNFSLKKTGYSAAQELDRRVTEMIQNGLNGGINL